MKTYGLLPSQTLESLTTDDNGDFLPPLDEGVTAVPLVKLPTPEVTSDQVAQPMLVWFDDRVERQWVLTERTLTDAERRAAMAAVFDNLSIDVQAAFYTARTAAEAAMNRGRFDIARAIIEAVDVPVELEDAKTAILSNFP